MKSSTFTFSKQERLCSKKFIENLFRSGHRLMIFPYSLHWQVVPSDSMPDGIPAQVLVSTSKKKFHHAVDRNRVKRLTRECYRQHKPQLYQYLKSRNITLLLAVNYVHTEIFNYATLMRKFDKLTTALINNIEHTTNTETPCP